MTHQPSDFMSMEPRRLIRTRNIHQTPKDKRTDLYSEQALALVSQDDHAGIPEGCNAISMTGKNKKGTTALQLFAVIEGDNFEHAKIVRAGFRVHGCIAMIAVASYLAQRLEGIKLTEALTIDVDELKEHIGEMPPEKGLTRHIGIEAVRALVGDWLYRQGVSWQKIQDQVACTPYELGCLICEDCSLRSTITELRFN